MKKNTFILGLLLGANVFSQTTSITKNADFANPKICNTSEAMKALYDLSPNEKKENENFERFTEHFAKEYATAKNSTAICYIIPVVFHVYGTSQSGYNINNTLIINALANVNNDFQGLNNDFSTVHNSFLGIRGTMPDINFALAQLDPNGNPTSGIVYHPVASGYGNGTGYDSLIAADAWDNVKYMNIYIQNDLYADSVYNNSGIAFYPNMTMTSNNTARIVYNGRYLGINTSTEFASVLSHEFGHWLNLIHPFEGGCLAPNDNVLDTPPCDFGGASYACHPSPTTNSPLNCDSNLINAENYMDYPGASGCYKMFTQGQVFRMYAGLMHPARQPLWQMTNLIATGLWQLCSSNGLTNSKFEKESLKIYPNPTSGKFTIMLSTDNGEIIVTDELGQQLIKIETQKTTELQLDKNGVYIVYVKTKQGTTTRKLVVNR